MRPPKVDEVDAQPQVLLMKAFLSGGTSCVYEVHTGAEGDGLSIEVAE